MAMSSHTKQEMPVPTSLRRERAIEARGASQQQLLVHKEARRKLTSSNILRLWCMLQALHPTRLSTPALEIGFMRIGPGPHAVSLT